MTNTPQCSISLLPNGSLVMHLLKRNGEAYDIELPQGNAEPILRELLRQKQQDPESGIGERAGATAFALKQILESMGQQHAITRVAAGKKALGLTTSKSLDDLGL